MMIQGFDSRLRYQTKEKNLGLFINIDPSTRLSIGLIIFYKNGISIWFQY